MNFDWQCNFHGNFYRFIKINLCGSLYDNALSQPVYINHKGCFQYPRGRLNYVIWNIWASRIAVPLYTVKSSQSLRISQFDQRKRLRSGIMKCIFLHDDVIKRKHFPRYWPFVRGIHRSLVNSPHKGQWRGALMFSSICACINGWVNNGEAGDLRRHRAHNARRCNRQCGCCWIWVKRVYVITKMMIASNLRSL